MSESTSPLNPAALAQQGKKKYVRAVGPRLRILLYFIFGLVALVGGNSAWLSSLAALDWALNRTDQTEF